MENVFIYTLPNQLENQIKELLKERGITNEIALEDMTKMYIFAIDAYGLRHEVENLATSKGMREAAQFIIDEVERRQREKENFMGKLRSK